MREDQMEILEKMFPNGFVLALPDSQNQGIRVYNHNPLKTPVVDKLYGDFTAVASRINFPSEDDEDDNEGDEWKGPFAPV